MPEVTVTEATIDTVQQAADTVQTTGQQVAQQGGWFTLILYCVVAFAVIYFLMVRPNKKRMMEYQKMLESIKIGDRIMAAGIYGTVKSINEKSLEIEIAKGVVIEVSKNAVAGIVEK